MTHLGRFIGLLCCGISTALAQYAAGVSIGAGVNLHTADFRTVSPDIPNCCPGFEAGSGAAWSLGLTYDGLPLAPRLRLLGELNYLRRDARLTQREAIVFSSDDGRAVAGTVQHELQTQLASLGITLLLGYSPLGSVPSLQLRAGIHTGWTVLAAFSQQELLVDPPYGRFLDTGTRSRNHYSGKLPNASSVSVLATVGARYLLPISDLFSLMPTVSGWFGLTPVVSGIAWRAHALHFSMGIVYSPLPEAPSPLRPGSPERP